MTSLHDRVAFVTGAARGQGRAHAAKLAREGADIVGVDICRQISTVHYAMSTPEDLAETSAIVTRQGRTMLALEADVRDRSSLDEAAAKAVATLGRIDIVVANAGIYIPASSPDETEAAFRDTIDVNLVGVWNTVEATLPPMIERGEGGSIVLISSVAGLRGGVTGIGGGTMGYAAAKHGIVGLMRKYSNLLAHHSIRVNSVHPTGVDTPMLDGFADGFAAFIESQPGGAPEAWAAQQQNPMPVPLIEPTDVANAVAWLVSDAARYVTGITLPVDAGLSNK